MTPCRHHPEPCDGTDHVHGDPSKAVIGDHTWIGYRCQRCLFEMRNALSGGLPGGPRMCPRCGYTVYDSIPLGERPDWDPRDVAVEQR